MKRRLVVEMGGSVTYTKIILASYDKRHVNIEKALVIDDPVSIRETEAITEGLRGMACSKTPVALVISEGYSHSYYQAQAGLKDDHVAKWVKTHISESKKFAYDVKDAGRLVKFDVFGRSRGKACGSIISCENKALEELYGAFRGYKLSVIPAASAFSLLNIDKNVSFRGDVSAVLELGEELFRLHVFSEGVLVLSLSDAYSGIDIFQSMEKECPQLEEEIIPFASGYGFSGAAGESSSLTKESKLLSAALVSAFAEDAKKIISKVNAARFKGYYPSSMKIIGTLSEIKAVDRWIELMLGDIKCEAVSIPAREYYDNIFNSTEEPLDPGCLSAAFIARGLEFEK